MESAWPGLEGDDGGIWSPPVDIEETEDAWVVEAELPGIDKKDVDIEVNNSEVRISGEIKERERKGILRRRTRPVGRFEFRVMLPGETDADNVDASIKHGVLTLRIPKLEHSQPNRIEVREGS
jgi:HSP20 family protein